MKRWPTNTLGKLIAIEKGKKTSEAFAIPTRTSVRYLQIEDLRPNANIKYCEPFNCPKATKADVIIAWDGANAGTVSCNLEGYIGSTLAVLRPIADKTLLPVFLSRFLEGSFDYLQRTATGATIPHVSKDALNSLQIPVPPLAEQERLVRLLDEGDELRKLRAQADRRTADLIPSLFHEMFGDPLANTKRLPLRRLGDLCAVSRGASPRPIDKYMGGTVPWIRIGDGSNSGPYITSTAEFVTEEGAEKSVLIPPGSLVVANSGVSCGFARILKIRGCIHDGWLALLNLKPELDPHYLLYFINQITLDLRGRAPSGTQPNLNIALVKSLEMPLPSLPLQKEFATHVSEIHALQAKQAASRRRLDDLFQSLLHRAFNGEL